MNTSALLLTRRRFGTQRAPLDRVPLFRRLASTASASDTNASCAEYAQALCAAPIDIAYIGEMGDISPLTTPHEADLMDPLLVKRVSLDEVCRMQQVHDGCLPAAATCLPTL